MSEAPVHPPDPLHPATKLTRRRLIKAGAGAAVALAATGFAPASAPAAGPPPQEVLPSEKPGSTNIVHSKTPPLEETRVSELEGLITPTRNFYLRNHFATPQIDADTWSLRVEGHVESPIEVRYQELRDHPGRKSVIAFLECAGNGRGRFDPPADGTKWINGAAGTAEWTGVPVSVLLERAGVKSGAVDVVCEGADRVTRGLPMEVAMDPDTLVAWAMNGEPLLPPHGWPARLFVPGWIGVASTKWLQRLEVIDQKFDGIYNTQRYVLEQRPSDRPTEPATLQPVKSYINRPAPDTTVRAGPQLITGYAWSGSGSIAMVEVSTDDGKTWEQARILEPRLARAWVRFEYLWNAEEMGAFILASRATDELGNAQPESVEWNRQGYYMNALYKLSVTVA